MLRNLFANMPDVVKNLLILNVLFFLATVVMQGQGIDLHRMLGMHYPSSNLFRPYQVITHFFMHGDFYHLLFNMFGLVIFGSHLERTWGKKRFFIFYFVTAIGALFLHTLVQGIEIYQITGEIFPQFDVYNIREVAGNRITWDVNPGTQAYADASSHYVVGILGASGAVYGLLMAFALLFPNTQFMLLFPPIPIKAKWMAIILGAMALYQAYQNSAEDSVAHFAHLGGMLFGFILIYIWRKDRSSFY
ncbi:MAG: rhomboid family intramembrane serine protease [Crocinitomicaceae bacterium]|nr:rhomboid family intramembrane serine protease [Crocinitomicaceae bacterium]